MTAPRFSPSDVFSGLRRELPLMLLVFLAVFAIGGGAALMLKKSYPANATIQVRLGQEYVYQPSLGDAARGATSTTDQMVQSELEILRSAELKERVIAKLGLGKVFPKLADKYAAGNIEERRKVMGEAVAAMEKQLKMTTAPQSSVVRLSYVDESPQRAANVLNAILDEYLSYRRTVLLDPSTGYLSDQRREFQTRLVQVNNDYQAFLDENGVTDFDAEKQSLNNLQASITDENYKVQARMREVQGRLGSMGAQSMELSPEVGLYRDTDPAAAQKLTQLQIELQGLLSRYKPNAQPVRDKQAQIAQAQAMAQRGQGEGARRFGVNPVFQTVQTEQIQLTAEAASLRQRGEALSGQLAQVGERRRLLTAIEPKYQDLARERDLLMENIKSLAQREQQSQAASAIALKSSDNIRVIERPVAPTKGTSLKKPAFILAFLFAAFTALCAGLLRWFLRRGPEPRVTATSGRVIDLPVLVTVPYKQAYS
ncbi:MAG: GumC family protein [Caulobacteraceae bacterium]